MESNGSKGERWRRALAFCVSALVVLAALVALRGPDAIGLQTAEAVGTWRVADNAVWHPLAPFGALAGFPFILWGLGMRGWQNTHVIVAWVTALCWLWPLAAKNWRGLLPLAPALLAVALGDAQSGLAPFGFAVLLMSAWRMLDLRDARNAWISLPATTWFAAWFSPGILPVAAALGLDHSSRAKPLRTTAAVLLTAAVVNLTPRGASVWQDAWTFLAWSPQPALDAMSVVALLASLLVAVLCLLMRLRTGPIGLVAGALLLFLAASGGQTGYLWPAGMMMIPCWALADESVRVSGFRPRWYMRLAVLLTAGCLVAAAAAAVLPRWYDLAMASPMVRPTLTRDALPKQRLIYLNPAGRPIARFGGSLTPRVVDGDGSRLLTREPSLWRAHDRRMHHQAVWLLGDAADYEPLARHLGASPDWRLAAVDATGLIFVRAPREEAFATEPAQQFAREQGAAANRSNFLSSAALSCLAAGAAPEAAELSRLAVRQSRESTLTAATRARALVAAGDMRGALDESARAIKLDPRSARAWEVRTEALMRAGRADEARAAAKRASELAPGDAGMLWLAARTANAVRAYQDESEILERLVSMTQGRGGDAGFYQLYLGLSYARQGLARPALRALKEAVTAPGLSEKQKAEIAAQIANIEASTR